MLVLKRKAQERIVIDGGFILVTIVRINRGRGAGFNHLQLDKPVWDCLSREDCQTLRQWVKSTGGIEVGSSIVKYDNTGAMAL